MLTKKQKELVCYKVCNEGGFYDCFKHYSRFEEIKDEKFQVLVHLILFIGDQLHDYLEMDKYSE